MEIDERLVKKGKNEPRDGLMQQGKVHVALAKQFAAELTDGGWSSDDTIALEGYVTSLDSTVAAQAEARLTASAAAETAAGSVDGSKAFLRRLRNALPRALREAKEPGLSMSTFAPGESLKRSTPRLSAYLTRIQPSVAKLDNHLMKAFGGKMASEVLVSIKSELDGADVTHEIAWRSLPKETLLVCETKGRVLEAIEDLNRAAKSAFDKQPETAALFNKDVLDRARRERKGKAKAKAKAEEAAPAEGKSTTTTPAEGKTPAIAPAKGTAVLGGEVKAPEAAPVEVNAG
jgi:hypothetical protein